MQFPSSVWLKSINYYYHAHKNNVGFLKYKRILFNAYKLKL